MDVQKVENKGLSLVDKAAIAAGVAMTAGGAFADVPDVSGVAASLTGLAVPIGVLGAAVLGLKVVMRGWKYVARMF